MEQLGISRNATEFDVAVHGPGSLRQIADMRLICKDAGTREGLPIAVITFTVELPDGTTRIAQGVTTVRLLKGALAALNGWYPDTNF